MNLADLEVVKQLLDMAADKNFVLTRVQSSPDAGWTVEFAAPPNPEPTALPAPAELTSLSAQPWQPLPAQPRQQHQSITHPSLWTNGRPPTFLAPIKEQ